MKNISTIILLLLLITCGKSQEDYIRHKTKNILDNPVAGGSVVIGISTEPDALNPLTALSKTSRDVIGLIFQRLAVINEDLTTFTPQLAKAWTFTRDSLAIKFLLRSDVKWHDNQRFTADDVVFTWKLQTDPKIIWDGIGFKDNIDTVFTVNDSTVIFRFTKKSRTMLMDAVEGCIVPKHILDSIPPENIHKSDFCQNPIGTGAFKFVQWKSQQIIYLEKNQDYYIENRPYLDYIIFKILPDNYSLYQQLISEEIDFSSGLSERNFQQIIMKWNDHSSAVMPISIPGRKYEYIGWNMIDPQNYAKCLKKYGSSYQNIQHFLKPNPLFGSQKVRAALSMAINKKEIIQLTSGGLAEPMHGPVPMIMKTYNPLANKHWDYNPQKALKLLSEEGWIDSDNDGVLDKDSLIFNFELLTNNGNIVREQIATIVQEQLKKIKIKTSIKKVDSGLLGGRILPQKKFDAVILGWNVGLKNDLSPLFHSTSFFSPFHFTGYYSIKFDSLQEQLNQTMDQNIVQNNSDEISQMLSHALPYTWLYYKKNNIAINQRINNAHFDKRGSLINVEDWWISENNRIYKE